MSTIEEKLKLLLKTKTDIRNALKAKGVEISPDTPFSEYDVAIKAIQAGDLLLVKDMQELLDKGEVTEETKALIYNEETDIFEGIYIYTDKTWQLMPTQLTAKAENIAPGFKAYGPDGVVEGNFTNDADATSPDIMNGKIAYVQGQKVIGNYIPLDTSDATAGSADILFPQTAYVNGVKLTGNITNVSIPSDVPDYESVPFVNTTGRGLFSCSYEHNLAVTRVNNYTVRLHKVVGGTISDSNPYIDINNNTLQSGSSAYYIYNVEFGQVNIDVNHVYLMFSWAVERSNFRASLLPINFTTFAIDGTAKTASCGRYTDGGTWTQYLWPRPTDPSTFVIAHNCNTNGEQHEMWGFSLDSTGTLIKRFEYVTTWFGAPSVNYGRWTTDGAYFYYTDCSKAQKIYSVNADATSWSLYKDSWSAIPIPITQSLAIQGTTIYSYPSGTAIGTSDVSITRSMNNYLTLKGMLVVLSSNILKMYKITTNSIEYLGELTQVQSCTLKNEIFQVVRTTSTNSYLFLDPENVENMVIALTRNGIQYHRLYEADGVAADVLAGKVLYNEYGKITGTMKNNGNLLYEPKTVAQSIPAGYTSGGTIAASSITSEEYDECLNLANQIAGNGGN